MGSMLILTLDNVFLVILKRIGYKIVHLTLNLIRWFYLPHRNI